MKARFAMIANVTLLVVTHYGDGGRWRLRLDLDALGLDQDILAADLETGPQLGGFCLRVRLCRNSLDFATMMSIVELVGLLHLG